MKKLFFIFILLSLLSFVTGGSIYAQNRVRADIPFAFTIANELLPAGSYTVERHWTLPSALVLASENLGTRLNALTIGVEHNSVKAVNPKLVFRRYGQQFFLATVWMGMGDSVGREIPKSAKERQVAKNSAEPELIYVAAK